MNIQENIETFEQLIDLRKSMNWPEDHAPVNSFGYNGLIDIIPNWRTGQLFLDYGTSQVT